MIKVIGGKTIFSPLKWSFFDDLNKIQFDQANYVLTQFETLIILCKGLCQDKKNNVGVRIENTNLVSWWTDKYWLMLEEPILLWFMINLSIPNYLVTLHWPTVNLRSSMWMSFTSNKWRTERLWQEVEKKSTTVWSIGRDL